MRGRGGFLSHKRTKTMCASNSDSSFVIKRSRFVFSRSFAVRHSPPFPSRPLSKMRHFRKPKSLFSLVQCAPEHRCLSTKDFSHFKILHSPSIAKGSENVMRRRREGRFLLAFFCAKGQSVCPKGFLPFFASSLVLQSVIIREPTL